MIKYTCGAGTPEEAETNCTYFIRGECTSSFCEYRRKKQTNADHIRAMSDEELARHLHCIGWDCHLCAEHIRLDNEPLMRGKKCDEKCAEHCLEWLQQPAEPQKEDSNAKMQ